MNFVLSENKIRDVIYKHLTANFYPDYDWGEELHDFYRKDVKNHGYVGFYIDDTVAYEYLDTPIFEKKLVLRPWISLELDKLFGKFWVPVFIEWFEHNSGLPVKEIEIEE